MPIGHGVPGAMPFTAQIPQHQEVDVGFLKFFVSTSPIDLSDVQQSSPFEQKSFRALTQAKRPPPVASWDVINIVVVQRTRMSSGTLLASPSL